MNIVVIMTCYNRKEKTLNCIDSIIKGNPYIDFHFVVVDDNSSDGTKELLLNQFTNVSVIDGTGNLFYSGGMRIGIQFVKDSKLFCDYVMFVNDDVHFYDNAIQKLIRINNGKLDIVVGATDDGNGNLTYGGITKLSSIRPKFKIVMSKNEIINCDTFNANCVLIRSNVFYLLENIDPIYGHSLGDFDYGLNAKMKGYKILVSDFFVGMCQDNPLSDGWLDKKKHRIDRLKLKESKKGLPFKEWFHFINKNYNFFSAVIFSMTQYIKILIKV